MFVAIQDMDTLSKPEKLPPIGGQKRWNSSFQKVANDNVVEIWATFFEKKSKM